MKCEYCDYTGSGACREKAAAIFCMASAKRQDTNANQEQLYGDQTQKADGGKHNPMLLQEDFVFQLATVNAVLAYGFAKYGQRGGWKSVDPERYKAAAARHRQAILMGESVDSESGLPHWAHLVCNELFLAWFETDDMSFDEKITMTVFNPPPQDHRSK